MVISAFEHKAVLAAGDRLATEGFRVARVGAHRDGLVDLEALEAALDERTAVVSVMLANNEVGTVQPLAVAALVRRRAARSCTPTPSRRSPWLDVGTAADRRRGSSPSRRTSSVARRASAPSSCATGRRSSRSLEGGGQGRGLRAGTVNVAGAVAMAAALSTTVERRSEDVRRTAVLRDRLCSTG